MKKRVFILKHIYLVLMMLSMVIVSIVGAFLLPAQEEGYLQVPALAGVAIHTAKDYLSRAGESGYIEDFPEGIENKDTPEISLSQNEQGSLLDENFAKEQEAAKQEKEMLSVSDNAVSENLISENLIQWQVVDDSYFDDALFIGDSRQKGFGLYSGLDNATTYASVGLSIFQVAKKPIVETPLGKITIPDALYLCSNNFKKVYIMFGINEIGYANDETEDSYFYNLIDYIKATQPDAVIYIESVISVTRAKEASASKFSLKNIKRRNEHLKTIAENENVYYLELNEILTDENGYLFSEATSDGVHLKSKYILLMKEYLKAHAIIREPVSANAISDNSVSENLLSANGISENALLQGEISENAVYQGEVSENVITGNQLFEQMFQEGTAQEKARSTDKSSGDGKKNTPTAADIPTQAAPEKGMVQAWVNGKLVTIPAP